MKKIIHPTLADQRPIAPVDATLDSEMKALLEAHFWCDFSDVFPQLRWQDETPRH